jgi:hypothetical protein
MGLYYCFMSERRHVLLFHYDEGVFQLAVTKPLMDGYGVTKNKLGPLMVARFYWNEQTNSWKECEEPTDSGFKALLDSDENLAATLADVHIKSDALTIERLLALSSGEALHSDDWFNANLLDSCLVESDEIVRRITFPGDTCDKAVSFRHARLQRAVALNYLLSNHTEWPPQVHDIQAARLDWSKNEPNYNVRKTGTSPALVVFLGEHPLPGKIRSVADGLLELLRRQGRDYQHRLAVVYRRHGDVIFAPLPALTRIDVVSDSLADIAEVIESEEDQ